MGETEQRNPPKAPGTSLEKLLAFIWNGFILGTYIAIHGFWQELFPPMTKYDYSKLQKHTGQTAVLTGGARGIGFQVLRKLLQLDYHVIFGARNIDAGEKAINQIRQEGIQTGHAKCMRLDLNSLKSVESFTENVLKTTAGIDVLINNAGIMMTPYDITEDGFEMQFQTNHLGHFLLTQLLLPKMKKTASGKSTNCRVVNVSSVGHLGSLAGNFKDVENPNVYCAYRAYYDSKMSQVLVTKYQDAMLKSEGANVNFYVLHPGCIVTDLYRHLPLVVQKVINLAARFFRSPDDGSEVVMYAVLSPDLEGNGGHYIVNKQIGRASSLSDDPALQKHIWDLSEKCVNAQR